MNARLYEPALGRFLSPDPYVQAPDFSQSFNRYSYCINNPLKFTDSSGYTWGIFKTFVKVAKWTYNAVADADATIVSVAVVTSLDAVVIPTSFAVGSFTGGFDKGFEMAGNSMKLNNGLGAAIRTRSLATIGGAMAGWSTAQYYNYTNKIQEIGEFHGATVVRLKQNEMPRSHAMTLGNFIIGDEVSTSIQYDKNGNLTLESSVLTHEYGHYLQSLHFGLIHYIESGINSVKHNNERDDTEAWSERDASLRGLEYVRGLGYSTKGFGESSWSESLNRDYWKPKYWWL